MNIIKVYYLIDFENVGCEGLNGCEKLGESDYIHLFYTNNNKKIDLDIISNHGAAKLITHKVPTGKQSADMHLGSYLGYLVGAKHMDQKESCKFVIVSKDTGYDPIIQFWKTEKKAKVVRIDKISNKQTKNKQKDNKQKDVKPENAKTLEVNPKERKQPKQKASKQQKKIIDMNVGLKKPQQEVEQILNNAGMSKEVVNYVSAVVGKNMEGKQRKQQIYKTIVSKYGQEKGLSIYSRIKKKI